MDMGNERTEFEQRCFQRLFGKRTTVDTGSLHYAQLHRALASQQSALKEMLRRRGGSGKIFRSISAGVGLFGGAGLGIVLGGGAVLQGFWMVLLGAAGAISGWHIVGWAGSLLLHKKPSLSLGLTLSGIWLLVALVAGAFSLGLWMVLGLLIAGIFLRIGGLRTPLGRQTAAQLRGLRHHLLWISASDLRQRTETDPDFFFRMLPYATALGIDRLFANRFGGQRLGPCPYLNSGDSLTARQWCDLMRKTLSAMESRANGLPAEKLLAFLRNITKR